MDHQICGPTRNSFLSGRRPQRTQSWNFIDHFREPKGGKTGDEPARCDFGSNFRRVLTSFLGVSHYFFGELWRSTEDGGLWASLPGYFKNNGYITMGGGKTYRETQS